MPFLKFSQSRFQARVGQGLPAKDRIIPTSRKLGGVDPNFLYSRTTSGVATSRKIRTGRERFAVFFSATFRRMKTTSRKVLVEVGGWGRDVTNERGWIFCSSPDVSSKTLLILWWIPWLKIILCYMQVELNCTWQYHKTRKQMSHITLTVSALFSCCSVSCNVLEYLLYSVLSTSCLFRLTAISFFTIEMSASILLCISVICSFCSCALLIDFRYPSISVSMAWILCLCRLKVNGFRNLLTFRGVC